MSIESIPKEQSKSSIVDLPKTVEPEIGGWVESEVENLDKEEKDEINDFSEQEIGEIVDNELETFDEILKIENENERREKINKHISQLLEEFEESEKTKKDFKIVMAKIQMLGINDKLDKDDVDRSWNQEQMDKLIKIFEKNEEGVNAPGEFRDYFPKLYSLLTTGYKKEKGEDTVSELTANTIIKRIENGGMLSAPLQSEIRMWCQNIQMIDKDVRTDLLTSALNNPGKLDESTSYEVLASLGLYGRNFIRQLKDLFKENKNNSNKILRIIEVLNFLRNKKYEVGFEGSGEEAEKILDEIYNENDNFFIKTRIEQVLNYDRRENIKRNNCYDNKDLRENYDIISYGAEGAYNEKEIIAASCYSRISEKYGALYNYNGTIDSVFELDKEDIEKKDSEEIQPKKLNVNEILEKEEFKKENMSEEEYEKMILTYKTLIELPMREKIENEFDIELNSFNIREQVQFVNFLSSKSVKETMEVKEFLNQGQNKEAKNNRIKAFLSLESGEEMGEKILNIGDKLDFRNADAIFAKYVEIISLTEKSKEELENLFKNRKGISDEEIRKITQNLISKAGQMLVDFSDKIGKGEKIDECDILKELEKYKADLILTASVYKGINKENVNFEDLEEVELEKKNANDLSDEEIEQIKDIYARNYKYNLKFQKAILDNFDNILKESGNKTEIYFYKDNNKVVAFNRFDVMNEGKKYFGSFNVDPVLSSSSIGSSLMKTSLEKEAENNEIEADCIPETLISSRYIGGGCGFVVKKINTDYKNTEVALFNIEKKKENKKYHYFNCSDKEIIKEYNSKNSDNQYNSYPERFILRFGPKSKELINITEKLIKENYVISNYVFSKNCKEVYCAFEKE
ncbi:MAG: hypothetical protein KAI71_06410 [Candidatus Pacebacteria bacterium]|nr:hypothetical protein [Candidatus Paceibacterota bacterium]